MGILESEEIVEVVTKAIDDARLLDIEVRKHIENKLKK